MNRDVPYPWQREYWRFSMWGEWDYISHGGLLVFLLGIPATLWWLL
jgi:hypothetical protein